MSLYIDQKYLLLISNRLPLFKKTKETTWNCRCVICGDSQKKAKKARGYFFANKNSLMYKCFNCDVSMFFNKFLQKIDLSLYNQYKLETYTTSVTSNTINYKFEQPSFKSKQDTLIDEILQSLDKLPHDNEAVLFCKKRQIPTEKFNKLYYIKNISEVVKFNEDYKHSIKTNEPRLVIPFYNEQKKLSGLTCRGLRGEALRYITIKIKKDEQLIFGINDVNKNKKVYVVEGGLDSLFLKNSIAMAGISSSKVMLSSISKDNVVFVFDNQPRNKSLVDIVDKTIQSDYNVVIWPQTIKEKDINDMVLSSIDVNNIISRNTFKGLEAKMKFVEWKRV